MTDSWEKASRKKKYIYYIVFIIAAVIAIGVLIGKNRITVFHGKDNTEKNQKKPDAVKYSGEQRKVKKDSTEEGIDKTEPDKSGSMLHSVNLSPVKCLLADREKIVIKVGLIIYFREEKIKKDILFKRDEISYVVKKVFSGKKLSRLVVDGLRKELAEEINLLLEHGKIVDIEFSDFQPVEKY